jgi:hypothetical protein
MANRDTSGRLYFYTVHDSNASCSFNLLILKGNKEIILLALRVL